MSYTVATLCLGAAAATSVPVFPHYEMTVFVASPHCPVNCLLLFKP